MYNYKSRSDMVKQAWILGLYAAKTLHLSDDYRNWSPIMVYCYHIGLIAGFIVGGAIGCYITLLILRVL